MPYRRLGAALLAVLMVLSQAVPTYAATPQRYPLVLGVSMNPDTSLAALDGFMASVGGHAPGIWSLWSDWGGTNGAFPDTALLDGIVARGSVPMLFWQPIDPTHLNDPAYAYSRISAGDFDAYLQQWAQAAKAWGGPIIAKFAQEMNGNWFPWSIGRLGNTAATFVRAWRHIVDVVRQEDATNVRFLWAPISPCGGCASFASLYPGDDYVDYAGFSTFDWYGSHELSYLVGKGVNEIAPLTKRPIIVAETGTPAVQHKIQWIRDGYLAVYAKYPQVRAIVYFDVYVYGQPDWRLDRPAGALAAYRALYDDPRFTSVLDDTSPPIDGQVTIDGGHSFARSRTVTLTPDASDDVGVAKVRVSEDRRLRGSSWRSYPSTIRFLLSSGDGPKTVYARFRDLSGNTSSRVFGSITLDRVAPRLSRLQVAGGAVSSTSRAVKVHLDARDARSGLSTYRLANESGKWSAWVSWPTEQPGIDVAWRLSNRVGSSTVRAQVRDQAGNVSAIRSTTIELETAMYASSPAVLIDGGADFTGDTAVILDLHAPADTTQVRISEHGDFAGADWEPYVAHRAWDLDAPAGQVTDATIHVAFRSDPSQAGTIASDDIVVDRGAPSPATGPDPVITANPDGGPGAFIATLDTHSTDQSGGSGVQWMQLSASPTFKDAIWERYRTTRDVAFSSLQDAAVFVRFRDGAGNMSAAVTRTLADPASPDVPTRVAPFDGVSTTSRRPTFRWQGLTGASGYQLQVDETIDFSSPLLSLSTTATKARPDAQLPKGKTLYWRVRQTDGRWSAPWRFKVPVADAPRLQSPADDAGLTTLWPTLEWGSVPSANAYAVQIATDGAFDDVLQQLTVTSRHLGVTGLARLATYHWRVRARVGGSWGAWSTGRAFTTPAGILPTP